MVYTLATYDTTPAAFADGVQPPPSPEYNAGTVQAAFTPTAKPKSKSHSWILLLFIGAAVAFAQTDNTLYVKQFAGTTVGAKLTNAMQACSGDSRVPCILVLDPSLAVYPTGSMPTLCTQCSLVDYRNGAPSASAAVLPVLSVSSFAGADASAKIAACFASIPAGGTCDARGFGATTQTISSTVTVPYGVTLLADPVTKWQPGSTSVNMFVFEPESHITGVTITCPSASYAGKVFANDQTQLYNPDGTSFTSGGTSLENVASDHTCTNVTGGTFLDLNAPAGKAIFALTLTHVKPQGFGDGVHLTVTGTGWINSVHFVDYKGQANGVCVHMTANTGTVGQAAQMIGNVFAPYSCEAQPGGGGTGILMDGSSTYTQISYNTFMGSIWDYTGASINQAITTATQNTYIGFVNGTVQDVTGGNYTWLANGFIRRSTFQLDSTGGDKLSADSSHNVYLEALGTLYLGASDQFAISPAGVLSGPSFYTGGSTVYRCATAGALPVGALTINAASCGTTASTGFLTK